MLLFTMIYRNRGAGNSFMCDLATDGKLVDVATAARAILDGLVARIDLV